MTISDGQYLLNSSVKKTRNEPKGIWLILTHHHSDHIFGMEVFKKEGAIVVAHKLTRDFLSHWSLPFFKRTKDTYRDFIIEILVKKLSYAEKKAEEILGDVKLSLPDEIFEGNYTLKVDGEDSLELLHTPGHVPGEISVYHKTSQTLFAGDTIYEGTPLTTRFGGPKQWRQWIESLEMLQQLNIKRIVPGHGNICGKEEIQKNVNYLEEFLAKH